MDDIGRPAGAASDHCPADGQTVCLTVTPSLVCNLRCRFCFQERFDDRVRLGDDILLRRLAAVYERTSLLILLGGEITVMPGGREYLATLLSRYPALRVEVVTNGARFDERWIELCASNRVKAVFSLNGSRPEVFRRVVDSPRGAKSWDAARLAVERLVERKARLGFVHPRPVISMVVVEETADDVLDFASLAFRLGAECKFLFDCRGPAHRSWPGFRRACEEVAAVKEAFRGITPVHVLNMPAEARPSVVAERPPNLPPALRLRPPAAPEGLAPTPPWREMERPWGSEPIDVDGRRVCGAPWRGMVLLPDGSFTFCSRLPGAILGNLNTSSLTELWNGEKAREIRAEMLAGRYPYCGDCPASGIGGDNDGR